jgi:hypothetical protein
LTVRRPENKGERELTFPLGAGGTRLPVRTGLIPAGGGDSEQLTLIARGFKGPTKVVQTEAVVAFVPGQQRLIQMFLAAACVNDPCTTNDQTCGAGGTCIARRRPTLPWNPGGTDGGAADRPPGLDGPASDAPIGTDAPDAPIGDDAGNCTCPSDDNPCTEDFCQGGSCMHRPLADRTGCTGGLCVGGTCCTGCLDGQGRCQPGDVAAGCGTGARDCAVCDDQEVCTQDRCEAGACKTQPLSGNMCPTGVCVMGSCHCGGAGEVCCAGGTCAGGMPCVNNTCGACGGMGQSCCSSNMCGPGLLCGSGQCSPCGDVGQPCCADGGCRTGVCGATNRICQACGGRGQPCCLVGNACGPSLACTGGLCACGGFGQPCCGGTMCAPDTNLCNGSEVCQNGTCGRTAAVACPAKDQCHTAGVCDPASGRCSEPLKPNGALCNDGNPCSSGDACQAGVCTPTVPSCNDNRACTRDTCTATGCTFAPLAAGTECAPPTMCATNTCDSAGNCVHTPLDGKSCSTSTGGIGRCTGDVCCPALMPNCG